MSKILTVEYYQENKKRPQKKAHKTYQDLFKEEKKQQYGRERYKNLRRWKK